MAAMSAQEIISAQKEEWTRVAPAWEKWDAVFDRNTSFVNYRLVAEARLRPGHRVLDLGSGTGYPALLAAEAVGPKGCVIGLDLSEAMLDVARRKAKDIGLSNVEFRTADVCELKFDDRSFDAVTSRFCLMFLPDVPKAVREIGRPWRSKSSVPSPSIGAMAAWRCRWLFEWWPLGSPWTDGGSY